jgi:hypothetical protein
MGFEVLAGEVELGLGVEMREELAALVGEGLYASLNEMLMDLQNYVHTCMDYLQLGDRGVPKSHWVSDIVGALVHIL